MRHLAVVPLVMILAACQFSENRYLARAVTSDELVGSWRATDFAIRSLRDVGVRDHLTVQAHTLVLRADGSCSLQTIMNMPVLEAAEYRTYDTGCRWRLGEIGHQALQFELTPAPVGWYSLLLFRRRGRPAAPLAGRHRSRCSAVHGIREDRLLTAPFNETPFLRAAELCRPPARP